MTNSQNPAGAWAEPERTVPVASAPVSGGPATVARIAAADVPAAPSHAWWWMGVALLAVGSAALSLWGIAGGARSEYYAAIAKSMSMSWNNFMFGAVDPAGTVSVDKIPGSFWFMALSVKLFGMSMFSVLLPNALATAGSVVVVAHAVRRWLGSSAGFMAGALFAMTPIVAAVARSNQPHVIFVFFLVLAADRAVVAMKTGSRRSLIAAGLWIAAAFQCYMLEAWALWPAIIVAWLVGTDLPWVQRIRDLLIAGVISGLASLSWIALVTITPASSRPWVGGSNGNSAIEMVFGYNGLGRFGQSGASGGPGFGGIANTANTSTSYRGFAAPFGGEAGPGRLFNAEVAGQIAWLMPAALIAMVVLLVVVFRSKQYFADRAPALFFAGWFVVYALMFSLSSGIHQFYTAALAPAIAALVAGAVVIAARSTHWYGRAGVAVMLLGTATYATTISTNYAVGYFDWAPMLQFGIATVAVVLVWFRPARVVRAIPFVLASALAFTPAVWAVDVVHHPNSINPIAGPGGGPDGFGGRDHDRSGQQGFALNNGTPSTSTMGQLPPFDPNDPDHGAGSDRPNFPGGPGGPRPNDPDHGAGTDRPDFPGGSFGGQPGGAGIGQPGGAGNGAAGLNSYDAELVTWLQQHRNGAKFLFATFGAMSAAPYITATGENVLPIGGFDGADPSPTVAQLEAWVKSGALQYVLTGGRGGGPGGGNAGSEEARQWVSAHCTAVTDAPSNGLVKCNA